MVPLKHCIRVLDGFGKSLEVILPKLGNGYIVPDPERRPRAGAGESGRVLPLAVGRVLPQRDRHRRQAAQPGSALDEARIARRAAADGRAGARHGARRRLRVAALGREIAELTGLLQRLEDEKREAERQAMTSGHTLHQLEGEMTRVRERLSTYERELQRVSARNAASAKRSSPRKAASCPQHEERQRALEAEMQAAQSSLEELAPAPR